MGKGSGGCDDRTPLLVGSEELPEKLPYITVSDLQKTVLTWTLHLPNDERVMVTRTTDEDGEPFFFIDGHWAADGRLIFQPYLDTPSQGKDGECPVSLLDGVHFKSVQAVANAVSGLAGEKVTYTVEGISYSASKSTDQYTYRCDIQRWQGEWVAHGKITFPFSIETTVIKREGKTRKEALASINSYIILMLHQHERYASVAA